MYYVGASLIKETNVSAAKILHLLVLILMPCLISMPAATAQLAAEPGVYLALGDSLAVGVGASAPSLGYVARLFSFFQPPTHTAGVVLKNLAVPGETSMSFAGASAGQPSQLARALAEIGAPTDVQVVTLDIGGNDLLGLLRVEPCASAPSSMACQELVAATLRTFAQYYTTILGALTTALAEDPGAERLLVMTVYNAFSGIGSPYEVPADVALLGSDRIVDCTANATDPARIGLNDLLTCMGRLSGAEIVDVYPQFTGKTRTLTHIGAGDIHPNDAGHAVIAEAFRAVFMAGRVVYLPLVQR